EAAAQQEALNAQVDDFSVYVEDVIGQIDALTEAYQNAYDAAYQSVSGQYDLWDKAADVVEVSAETINKNMEGQIGYWQDYNANLKKLNDRADDIEGLSDVIASFADGSEESVNAIAGMADASDDELMKMVENYQALQEEQVTVSDSIAQMVTDYTDQMQQLVDQVAEDIDAMNLSDEAAQACQDTLNAYIDAAGEMEPLVGAAYQAVASSANAALDSIAKNFRVSMSTDASGVTLKTIYYARGTDDAAKGLAVVGEEGPELVYFSGGEQVIPNDETKQLLALAAQNDITAYSGGTEIAAILPQLAAILADAEGTGTNQPVAENAIVNNNSYETNRSVAVTINISGDASKETVQELQGYGDEFAQRVLAVIEEYDEDMTRGAYA
ncbi:MAG: hypothetical protein LUD25_02445, partial [Coriobacteriaceae bacterium]|nr:hypothetical protein [Coriobacteriaceae bacterium]